jgi:hypothetical protein
VVGKIMYNPPIYGAYVQLFAGVSDQVTLEKTGCWSECSHAQILYSPIVRI